MYKNPNLNLPTKNDVDRKSPLKLRPNLPANPVISNRNHSNTLPMAPKLSGEQTPPQNTNSFNFQQSPQQQQQSSPNNNNPLKTTFVYQGPGLGQSQPLQTTGSNFQPFGSMPLKQTPQNLSNYNPLSQNPTGQPNINQNSMHNLQTIPSNPPKGPNFMTSEIVNNRVNFENNPKESNVSSYSRTNTLNEPSRFQSNVNPPARPSEINENLSYHSKLSTNSRNHVLRAISVNNEDHLMNLSNKEDTLKNQNILIVNNFLQSVESAKRNVLRNMTENFKSRVHEIWNSYLMEQLKSSPQNLDVHSLNQDVEQIKKVFLDFLLVKTDVYVEELKNNLLTDIFKEIDAINNQKQYLDNRVRDIIENAYNPVKSKNNELRDKVTDAKNAYKNLIEQTIQKYEKTREAHIDMYDREFAFKLNGDQMLVKNTLRNAMPFLQGENKKADERLLANRTKGPNSIETLQNEIKFLENEIKFYKK